MRAAFTVSCGVWALLTPAAAVTAQSLADRISSAGTGAVSFHYTARPGVCGDGEHFIRTGRSSYHGSFSKRYPSEPCLVGPVQVRLTLSDGVVDRIQYWVGPLRSREARDLGDVPAPEAARYLLTVAERGGHVVSGKAIFPAVLADSAVVWPTLLAIARDTDTRSRATRQDAAFWLSRFASGVLLGHPGSPLDDDDDDDPDDDLKSNAVFVLSQLPRSEGIPSLLEVARTNPSPRVRSKALFWLGQSGDPRAIVLFESILRK